MNLDTHAKAIRSVLDVIKLGTYQESFVDDNEEATTLLSLVRMGLNACDALDEIIQVLRNLCMEQEQRDVIAQRKQKYEAEMEEIRANLRQKEA
jgi:protein-arginine kinase